MPILKTTAIIVNYKVSSLTLEAVQSILNSDAIGSVHVVVVDNSEDKDEAAFLRSKLPSVATLWENHQNLGFGRACNLGFEKSKGDLILLINPDAKLLPGCLLRLQKTLLYTKNAGAVSPRIFLDEDRRFLFPPCCPPSVFLYQPIFDSWGPQARIMRLFSILWRYYSIKVWQSKMPMRVSNLTGGMALLKRESVRKAGGLFDARFFLYYEDLDLFIRIRKAGYDLITDSRAEAIHYYDQCGIEDFATKRLHMIDSASSFLRKYNKGWRSGIGKLLMYLKYLPQGTQTPSFVPEFTAPFTMDVPAYQSKEWLFEWSPNPTFVPAVGEFGSGSLIEFPEKYWNKLAPGRYFGRLGGIKLFDPPFKQVSWITGKKA